MNFLPSKVLPQIFQSAAEGFFGRRVNGFAFQAFAVDGLFDQGAELALDGYGPQHVLRLILDHDPPGASVWVQPQGSVAASQPIRRCQWHRFHQLFNALGPSRLSQILLNRHSDSFPSMWHGGKDAGANSQLFDS